jgi:aspartyl aminopeptidase
MDPVNLPRLGGGPVVKVNANCKYMTDARSAAYFKQLCKLEGVPCQEFVNHSDSPGGSTLGNILTSTLDIDGVDMGIGLWAMHSARETASLTDIDYTIKVFRRFYQS